VVVFKYVMTKIHQKPRGGGPICTTIRAAAEKHWTPPSRMCGFKEIWILCLLVFYEVADQSARPYEPQQKSIQPLHHACVGFRKYEFCVFWLFTRRRTNLHDHTSRSRKALNPSFTHVWILANMNFVSFVFFIYIFLFYCVFYLWV